jgi:hypothetical protein
MVKDLTCSLHWHTGALAFDVEYARWLEEQNKQINELRSAVNSHAGDTELRTIVDNVVAHFDDIFRLKGIAAKADVFHILSGMWKTPAERCFLWIGGFRSSELLKVSFFFVLSLFSYAVDKDVMQWNWNLFHKVSALIVNVFWGCFFVFGLKKC